MGSGLTPSSPRIVKLSFYIAASSTWPSEGRVVCWRMDSATWPSAPRRMTGWWECWEEWKFYFREINHKGVWCFVYVLLGDAVWSGFGLMLWVSVSEWCFFYWLYIDWACLYCALMKLWVFGFGMRLRSLVLDWWCSYWLKMVMCIALEWCCAYFFLDWCRVHCFWINAV